jgi:hypothetical protein
MCEQHGARTHTSDDIGGLGGIRQQRQPVAALHLHPGAAIRSGRPATPVTTMILASPSTKVFGCEQVSKVYLEAAPPRQSPSGGEVPGSNHRRHRY